MVVHKKVHAVYVKVIQHYYSFWLNLTAKRQTSCSSAWLHSVLSRACELPEMHLQSFGGGYSQRKNSCEASVSQPKLQHHGCVFVSTARHHAANFQPSFIVFMVANSSGGKLDVFSMNSRSKLVGFRSQTPLDAHSALGSWFYFTSVFLSAIGNAIRGYLPVTLERMGCTWSLLFPKLCFPFLVTYFCLSPTAHSSVFADNFSPFSSAANGSSFFSLAAFCTMSCNIPSAESLGQRKNMYLCPCNMALGSRRVYTSHMELYDFRWERSNWSRWILRELFICNCISGSLWFKCLWAKLWKKYFSFKNSLWRA